MKNHSGHQSPYGKDTFPNDKTTSHVEHGHPHHKSGKEFRPEKGMPFALHSPTHSSGSHTVDHHGHEELFRHRFWGSLLLTLPVLLYSHEIQSWFGFQAPAFPGSQWVPLVFSIIIFIYGGIPFLRMAVPELHNRQPGMMTLISLAISTAFVYGVLGTFLPVGEGFFWELVTLIDIMLLGHWLEMRSVRQASGALNELARLIPDTAERLSPDGQVETIPVSALRNDDLVLVRPGSTIPADGIVVEGESRVNEAMITGESQPVKKEKASKVIAGTLNGEGSLRIRVTAVGEQTALAGIMRLVEQAQQSKSRTQVLADRAAGWLFYIAVGVAILTALIWSVAVGFNVEVLKRVVTVLVIACPHALGLAVPLVIAITTTLGARNGILVRNRLALEMAREVNVVIFDKTGTLTEGKFGVVAITTTANWNEDRALAFAAAAEGDSEHLIAQALQQAAHLRKLSLPEVKRFEALKGRGVQAVVEEKTIYVGGPRLLEMLRLELSAPLREFTQEHEKKARTVVYLCTKEEVIAAFAVADVIRPQSREAVQRLHQMGIEVTMLTGDSPVVARAVGEEVGIDRIFAGILPEHKDQIVAELQTQGKRVAMVGDGINDAPALSRADVGIAIGGGTDVAIESAGIILVQNNPLDVVKIIALSRASYRKMVENLWWAAGYNIITLPLAAGVLAPWGISLSPAMGAFLMSLSTLVVALNAQTLRRISL